MKVLILSLFLVVFAAMASGCSWMKGSEEPPPPPPQLDCDGFGGQVSGVWNDSVLEDLELTLKVYQGELDAGGAERIVAIASQFSKRWVTKRKDACDAQNGPNRATNAQYAATVDCLERALSNFKSSIDSFKGGDTGAFDSIPSELDNCI